MKAAVICVIVALGFSTVSRTLAQMNGWTSYIFLDTELRLYAKEWRSSYSLGLLYPSDECFRTTL